MHARAALFVVAGCASQFGLEKVTYDPSTCVTDADCADVAATARCDCGNCAVVDATCATTNRRWLADAPKPLGDACVPAPDQIDATVFHACATMSDGTVRCWGANTQGQLGAGQPFGVDASIPIEVRSAAGAVLGDVVEVETGAFHTCARHIDGTVVCWGSNQFGQLGANLPIGTDGIVDPVQVATENGPLQATALSVGFFHACALAGGGDVYCWGNNGRAQLGDGTRENRNVAVRVGALPGPASRIASGGEHTCAIVAARAYCWGRIGSGRLGDNTPTTADGEQPAPVAVRWTMADALPDVTEISAGNRHTCAIKNPPGELYCWGKNDTGALGLGTTMDAPIAIRVSPPAGPVSHVASGHDHTCATIADDTQCWGTDLRGQLGDGTDDNAPELRPVTVIENEPLADLTTGFELTCALGGNRTLRCWGANEYGNLGLGDSTPRDAPSELPTAAWCPALD